MLAIDGRVPDAGDVFWVDHGDGVGHEQGGRRPSLVLTERRVQSAFVSVRRLPYHAKKPALGAFQVPISPVGKITGYALVDQLRVIDPVQRCSTFAGRVSDETLTRVRRMLVVLLGLGTIEVEAEG